MEMPSATDYPLSAFADEIDPSLTVQLEWLQKLGIGGLDLRSVDGINVLDLTTADVMKIGEACEAANISIQSIGSPVNKIDYDVLLQGRELDRLDTAIRAALRLNTKRIRIFTPRLLEENEDHVQRIIDWMREQKVRAEMQGLILIVENDAQFWSAYPDNAKRLFDELGSPSFRAAFDFANTVLIGFRPMRDWFPWLLPHLDTLHIKDAIESEHRVVPAGQGDGQLEETLSWLVAQGWQGPLTLEPHLQSAGPLGGYSGGELFEVATQALRDVLARIGLVPA
jgi:sugar phosphate isomerase/epimerase